MGRESREYVPDVVRNMALASFIMNSEKPGSFPFLSRRERSHKSAFSMFVLDVTFNHGFRETRIRDQHERSRRHSPVNYPITECVSVSGGTYLRK